MTTNAKSCGPRRRFVALTCFPKSARFPSVAALFMGPTWSVENLDVPFKQLVDRCREVLRDEKRWSAGARARGAEEFPF